MLPEPYNQKYVLDILSSHLTGQYNLFGGTVHLSPDTWHPLGAPYHRAREQNQPETGSKYLDTGATDFTVPRSYPMNNSHIFAE